eukprot:CAMPEP_0117692816 /NCGR_PEP_ID=MMETSP0804-20121206/26528_1 /TAXON_ID=1074897 /ORGANISM="Tetraselmis astigmatica, Strain CCMP880" /LENGTH=513 /DNA_ID=CAMNT_0005506287 /DNA_START=36 /DNA_END=1578 /DNA_ORIENTATION=-
MAELRELVASGVMASGTSAQRKEDRLWLPVLPEPLPASSLLWDKGQQQPATAMSRQLRALASLSDIDVDSWFHSASVAAMSSLARRRAVGAAAVAAGNGEAEEGAGREAQQMSESMPSDATMLDVRAVRSGPEGGNGVLPRPSAAPRGVVGGESEPSALPYQQVMTAASEADSQAEAWFNNYCIGSRPQRQRTEAMALMSKVCSAATRRSLAPPPAGPAPPPQFCATLRAEIHDKVVLGNAGKQLFIQLSQEVFDGLKEVHLPASTSRGDQGRGATADAASEQMPGGRAGPQGRGSPAMEGAGPPRGLLSGLKPTGRLGPEHNRSGAALKGGPGLFRAIDRQQAFGVAEPGAASAKAAKQAGNGPGKRPKGGSVPQGKPSKDTPGSAGPKKAESAEAAILDIVTKLQDYDEAELKSCFARPVLDTYPELRAQYLEKVDHPMALSDIKKKVRQGKYSGTVGLSVFKKDVETMVNNCKIFNVPNSVYHGYANSLYIKFKALLAKATRAAKKPAGW